MLSKALLILLFAVSVFVSFFCLFIYTREIFNSFSAADKSLLYWYLPFLFVGLISTRVAIGSFKAIRNRKSIIS
jgi:hypothetical protein